MHTSRREAVVAEWQVSRRPSSRQVRTQWCPPPQAGERQVEAGPAQYPVGLLQAV